MSINKPLIILFTFFSSISFSQNVAKQVVKSEISDVKLYLTAGQMGHEEKLKLEKGRNRIEFVGLSAFTDPQSIQFECDVPYRLVSVTTEMDFLAAEQVNPRIGDLKDSLDILNDELQFVKDQMDAFYAEEAVLNTNRNLGGKNESISIDEIKAAATYYRERTLEIRIELAKLRKEQRNLNIEIENTRFQLVELNYNENQKSNQVVILLDVENAVTTNSKLNYLVTDCGWAAIYDLSAEDIQSKVNLKYNAQVYNNTGKEWKNINLTLSTADPGLSASVPELDPWYLNSFSVQGAGKKGYYAPQNFQQGYRDEAASGLNMANQRVYDNYYISNGEQENLNRSNSFVLSNKIKLGNDGVQMKNIEISELTAEFEIEHKFSCPTDAKPYLVNVNSFILDAKFSHITVPKLDRSAFLIAHIAGWQELDLIPGKTNVYFGGSYVGMSEIDVRNVSDTLSLSFGRDDQVTVMRKLKKEFSSKSVMGNFKKESYSYEIAIKNNRYVPIRIEVYDQIPVSSNDDITIFEDDISGGKKDSETGEVLWNKSIPANGVEGSSLGYTVKYPKSSQIMMKSFRTISCPSF